ncbi:hypothetical protein Q7P37_010128 [Cladosporium fusiforme]
MPPFPIHIPTPATPFPTYLVPALPFRRRQSSTSTIETARSNSVSTSSPPANLESFLTGAASHLRCARCLSDLALSSQIISKGFTGRHGRAYLVAPSASSISPNPITLRTAKQKNDALPNLPNTFTHKPVPRQLVTGAHTVSDISCAQCGSVLGWKYVAAEDEGQRYKVGKFILETKKVCRSSTWENEDGDEEVQAGGGISGAGRRKSSLALPPESIPNVKEETEFDSQDEDECEDLFMGVWTPQLAERRRRAKIVEGIDE